MQTAITSYSWLSGLTLREHRIHMELQYRGEASGSVTYMNNSEAPFGLERMAERKLRSQMLKCYKRMMLVFYHHRPVCA